MFTFKDEKELRKFINEEILFTSEVAELLNCTRQYIYKLVKEGKLEPVKTATKERLFFKSDILYFNERRK